MPSTKRDSERSTSCSRIQSVPALRSFYEEVSGMLDDDRGTESDDEVKGSGVARFMRRIRSAKREYRQATPSPQGKLGNRTPKQGDPVKGMSSKANVASRHLHAQFETSTDAPSEASGSSDLMQALRGHFVTAPSPSDYEKDTSKKTDTHRPIQSHSGLPQRCS